MYFNENMTSAEALKVLCNVIDGKTEREVKEIRAEYEKYNPEITKREMNGKPCMTSYVF